MNDDDDVPRLPTDTLQLLQDFTNEKDARAKEFQNLQNQSENDFQNGKANLSMDLFGEDWNASQFWYTDETARILAQELFVGANDDSGIAVVSAPSVYLQLRKILEEEATSVKPKVCLLEYDKRFEVIGTDFVHYDYNTPLSVPSELKERFDRIICDPPFLSEDCQAKTALTVRYLARSWTPMSDSDDGLRLISCTGERMETMITKLYGKVGVKTTTFEPEHRKGLSNEFRCYANFEGEKWTWR